MSLTYVVDGYNLIMRSGLFRDLELRASRDRLCSYFESHRPHGSRANRLVVVFDGSSRVFGFKEDRSFEVVFTQDETADERIAAIVASSRQPKNVVVVTDDKSLARQVRGLGAKTMATCEFLEKGRPEASAEGAPDLNIAERDKITEEMRRIWLKKK